ncbi:hypothetical protein ABLE91_23495 [Aquabacter sp. CN5-332]|uniref:hypothetical protein n=1 Tax=Aquabacter sp. CN5-332 TaxID=3156608 RepID=UPI0032B591DC
MLLTALDDKSRATIGRFWLKLACAAVFAVLTRESYLASLGGWLSLYALFTAGIALLLEKGLSPTGFNHWDEVLWLTFLAQAMKLAHRMVT